MASSERSGAGDDRNGAGSDRFLITKAIPTLASTLDRDSEGWGTVLYQDAAASYSRLSIRSRRSPHHLNLSLPVRNKPSTPL